MGIRLTLCVKHIIFRFATLPVGEARLNQANVIARPKTHVINWGGQTELNLPGLRTKSEADAISTFKIVLYVMFCETYLD